MLGAVPAMTPSYASGWTVTPLLLGHRQAHAAWFGYLESDSGTLKIVVKAKFRCRIPT